MACGLGILQGMGESIQFRPDITRGGWWGEVMGEKKLLKKAVHRHVSIGVV